MEKSERKLRPKPGGATVGLALVTQTHTHTIYMHAHTLTTHKITQSQTTCSACVEQLHTTSPLARTYKQQCSLAQGLHYYSTIGWHNAKQPSDWPGVTHTYCSTGIKGDE